MTTGEKMLKGLVLFVLFFNGAGALFGGYSFMTDPTGNGLGMTSVELQYSPFHDYFIPGIILFIANGIFSFVVFFFVLLKWKYYKQALQFQGALLTGWIIIQILMLQMIHPWHILLGSFGIILLLASPKLKS